MRMSERMETQINSSGEDSKRAYVETVLQRGVWPKSSALIGMIDVEMQFALTQLTQPKERKLMSSHFRLERRITK